MHVLCNNIGETAYGGGSWDDGYNVIDDDDDQ